MNPVEDAIISDEDNCAPVSGSEAVNKAERKVLDFFPCCIAFVVHYIKSEEIDDTVFNFEFPSFTAFDGGIFHRNGIIHGIPYNCISILLKINTLETAIHLPLI